MNETLIIRAAELRDAESIARLEEICFPAPWSLDSILHDIRENDLAIVLVAECEGVIAGYADVWSVAGEGQLNNIAVLPKMRGRQIGQRLMEVLITTLRRSGHTLMTLEVRRGNAPAIRLYEKLGFEMAGIRPGYYLDNGEDALLMSLVLA